MNMTARQVMGAGVDWRPEGCAAQGGFTMVELITVIMILGLIAVVATPRLADIGTFESGAAADQAKSVLRYAQKVAIASHGAVTVNISAGDPSDCGAVVTGGVLKCVLPAGVSLGGALSPRFDFMGRPVPNLATLVTVGGTTITIEAETGYVH